MTTQPKAPAKINKPEPHDPFKLVSLEQIFTLFDDGDFLRKVLSDHKGLQRALLDHKDEHGTKGCQGSMTLQINYALGKSGDVSMGATATFKEPKKPASSAAAYINDDGELTLYSPFMKRMHQPVRDAGDVPRHDPVSGEILDA